ncbi:hydrogenase expression/formation protein [Candidatus Aerophobetes bacterium]|nr:hydrogenase expression/formation protein [Candidatus Aerophobetes bacterium]
MKKKINSKSKIGKIDPLFLENFLSKLNLDKNSVIVGPGIGRDAALLKVKDQIISVKTDPITFTSRNLAIYLVNINANDIACTGATPRWLLVTVLLPPEEKTDFLGKFFNQLQTICQRMEISLVGGHTEFTPAVRQPVVVGCMIGELEEKRFIDNTRAKPGDSVFLVKGIAIEGTHVIYQEKKKILKKEMPDEILQKIGSFLKNPGISVVKEAKIALKNADVHCLHDLTEGGLIAGIWEVARASEVGIYIEEEKVPVFEETKLLCEKFSLDPLSLLASGALLVIINPEDEEKLLCAYRKAKITCAKIGKITPKEEGVIIKGKKGIRKIHLPPPEELGKLFSNEAEGGKTCQK